MPAASLHGVTLAWSCEGLAIDPLAETLAMVEPAAANGDQTLHFTLRPADPSAAEDPRAEGWEPSFFHGIVQAYRRGDAFLLHDRASRVLLPAVGPIEAAVAPPEREVEPGSAGAMLQIAVALGLRRFGLYHLHAAALRDEAGRAMLVVGGSGAGKTSTTLALLEAGASWLGDDALFLAASAGSVRVAAFPRAFHLGPATIAAFPRLAPLTGAPGGRGTKRPLEPRLAWPGRQLTEVAPAAGRTLAIFPTVTGAEVTEIVPMARADAFGLLLASSAALVLPGLPGREANLGLLQGLLAVSRCHELRLGRDALADPGEAVARRIARL
jgi:hypothetical protein